MSDLSHDELFALLPALIHMEERDREIFVDMYVVGQSQEQIADRLGLSRSRVQQISARARGVAHDVLLGRTPKRRGYTQYPVEMVEAARELRQAGFKLQVIADRLGVSITTVNRWVNPVYREWHRNYMRSYMRSQKEGVAA